MKATLTTRMARLEARNPGEVHPILSDEELSQGLALIRAVIGLQEIRPHRD